MTEDFVVAFESSEDLTASFSEQITMGSLPYYEGDTEVTPSNQRQVLHTADKSMSSNVVVKPIPSNYGLITYNGFEIMVS